ncbi:hypothetical protein THAOC_10693, partial [Thalassiosira oceanica]
MAQSVAHESHAHRSRQIDDCQQHRRCINGCLRPKEATDRPNGPVGAKGHSAEQDRPRKEGKQADQASGEIFRPKSGDGSDGAS